MLRTRVNSITSALYLLIILFFFQNCESNLDYSQLDSQEPSVVVDGDLQNPVQSGWYLAESTSPTGRFEQSTFSWITSMFTDLLITNYRVLNTDGNYYEGYGLYFDPATDSCVIESVWFTFSQLIPVTECKGAKLEVFVNTQYVSDTALMKNQ